MKEPQTYTVEMYLFAKATAFLNAVRERLTADEIEMFTAAIDEAESEGNLDGGDEGYSNGYDDGRNAAEFDHDDAIENARSESFDEGYAQGRADATSEEHD